MWRRWAGLGCIVLAGLLSGCNTVEGLGKDIEKGGAAIQRSVKQ